MFGLMRKSLSSFKERFPLYSILGLKTSTHLEAPAHHELVKDLMDPLSGQMLKTI